MSNFVKKLSTALHSNLKKTEAQDVSPYKGEEADDL